VPTFSSIEEALDYLRLADLVFVIGGGEVYRQTISKADKLFVTEINETFDGDTYFPEYRNDIGSVWKEIKREDHPELSFVVYERLTS
jgi:dihydrofolate reductase